MRKRLALAGFFAAAVLVTAGVTLFSFAAGFICAGLCLAALTVLTLEV